jgi:hypothetical protein
MYCESGHCCAGVVLWLLIVERSATLQCLTDALHVCVICMRYLCVLCVHSQDILHSQMEAGVCEALGVKVQLELKMAVGPTWGTMRTVVNNG